MLTKKLSMKDCNLQEHSGAKRPNLYARSRSQTKKATGEPMIMLSDIVFKFFWKSVSQPLPEGKESSILIQRWLPMIVFKFQWQPEQNVMWHFSSLKCDSNESMYFSFKKRIQKATSHICHCPVVETWVTSMCIGTRVTSKETNGSKRHRIDA